MWTVAVPVWELVLRAVVVYFFLLLLLRLTGKRQVGQLAPFDLVLLLVLSNAVQNSMNAGDNSLGGGLVSAATLVALNYGMGYATFRSKKLETLVEGPAGNRHSQRQDLRGRHEARAADASRAERCPPAGGLHLP